MYRRGRQAKVKIPHDQSFRVGGGGGDGGAGGGGGGATATKPVVVVARADGRVVVMHH